MTKSVLIKNGTAYKKPVKDVTFEVVRDYREGARGNYITVKPNGWNGDDRPAIRISVNSPDDFEIVGEADAPAPKRAETDEEIIARIGTRFEHLDEMTKATINGDVRAMIVVGPPGVGKSYGVEYQLDKAGMFDKIAGNRIKYEVVKGAMTAVGLYCTLYRFADEGNVLVFDDCDSILMDDLSLNILKAALDSGKKRRIYWNSDSAMLRREGVPDQFDFKGAVIFITNLQFDHIKSKKLQDHLGALQSRCHYLDLTLNTMRDKVLRIKQIYQKGELFKDYDFDEARGDEIIEFMEQNQDRLREMSLRMALKIADLTKVSETNWRSLAENTVMKSSF